METKIKAKSKTETEKLFSDLSKPSLHALSYILRHPDAWPKGFVWDFSNCSKCAMGLAHRLWDEIPKTNNENAPSIMAQTFGIPYSTANSVFMGKDTGEDADWRVRKVPGRFGREKKTKIELEDISPEMVAEQIDKYLETVE